MTIAEIIERIKREFVPVDVIETDPQLQDNIVSAIRKFNEFTWVTKKVSVNYNGTNSVEIPEAAGSEVVSITANQLPNNLGRQDIIKDLIGVRPIDEINVSDIVLSQAAIQSTRTALGKNMDWRWESPVLYLDDVPTGTNRLLVEYTLIYDSFDTGVDISNEGALDWIIRYSIALTKIKEGNILIKSSAVDMEVQGGDLKDQGIEERKELIEEIKEKRLILFMERY